MSVVSTIFSYVLALLVLGVIIFIHELGHYGVARLFGIKVLEFAIGMGPKLLSWKRNDIRYSLRAVPIGGFCRFYGEDEAVRDKDCFNAHAPYKRFLVLFAGALMNLVAAYLLAVVFAGAYGDMVPNVYEVIPGTPAVQAGFKAKDNILSVDGKKVWIDEDVTAAIRAGNPEHIAIEISRGGERMELVARNVYDAEQERNFVGIQMHYGVEPVKGANIFPAGWRYVRTGVQDIFNFLGGLFSRPVQQGEALGPVGVVNIISQAVRTEFMNVMLIALSISISLGVMNLLPFPGLDGARILFVLYEGVTGKPVNREVEGVIHFVGVVVLLGLAVFLTFNDIKSIIGG